MKDRQEYDRRYYEKHKAMIRLRNKAQRERVCAYIRQVKESGSCLNCGESDWRCLAFHHREPELKLFCIGEARSLDKGLQTVKDEIEKCDLICHNCHAKLHLQE